MKEVSWLKTKRIKRNDKKQEIKSLRIGIQEGTKKRKHERKQKNSTNRENKSRKQSYISLRIKRTITEQMQGG